ncbi:MAG: hypothetical protein EPN30_05450 [Actinomycetota bacterium]|nr:MAG: hypothetical protein EPN30_05450 [Actinomycetota bacterium]
MSLNSKANAKSQASEFIELLIAYVKQETLQPISRLGRYVLFGLAGSILIATGSVLLIVGFLRLLQSETGSAFTGHLNWLPYVFSALLGLIVVAAAVFGIFKKRDARSI